MPKQFKTREELDNYLKGKMETAMDEVYDKLLDKLIDFIKEDVYDNPTYIPQTESPFYERTEDMLKKENWKISRSVRNGQISYRIDFVGDGITYDLPNFVHGNNKYGRLDPENFVEILNRGNKSYKLFGNFPYIYRRPFWDDFLAYTEKWYPKLVANAMKRNGININ